MRSDTIGEALALLLVMAFVIAGLWFAMTSSPTPLPACDYGRTQNCEL